MRGQRNISYSGYGVPPEHAYPFPNGPVGEVSLSCPLFGGLGDAFNRDLDVGTLVPGLLISRCPTAIIGGIPTVVVYPVEFEAGSETSIHVGNEMFDGEPSFTDINSTGSVSIPALIFGVSAAFEHVSPSCVETMIPKAVCFVSQCPTPSVWSGRDSNKFN
jgi:hypothetical protein